MAEAAGIDLDRMSLEELRDECRKLNLGVTGSKPVLRQRLKTVSEQRDRSEAEDHDDSDDSEGDEEELHNRNEKQENTEVKTMVMQQPLTFKDVEDSLQMFSADGRQNIRRWLEDFNETSKICLWSNAQKVIYAKKLLRGPAKLFVTYEDCCRTWEKLEKALISEFGKTTNSKQVHQELAQARKRNNESYHEYVYRMMEIASHAEIEIEAKIQYIIDGIPDDPINKTILYGAQDIRQLRKKLTQYESMRGLVNQRSKPQGSKPSKDTTKGPRDQGTRTRDEKRCYNCGEKNHLGAKCPLKEKGTKCFSCGEFGHIATKCSKKEHLRQVNECIIIGDRDNKIYKTVDIKGKNIVALLDTGSDLNIIRAEQYIKLASPDLTGPSIICKGLGAENISTLGSFIADVWIDKDVFRLVVHVVSDVHTHHTLLLGSDLLRLASISWDGTSMTVTKREVESSKYNAANKPSDVPEIFCIDVTDSRNDDHESSRYNITIDSTVDPAVKYEVEGMITKYQPQKTKHVAISLSLVLKDEIPVYERARRLAPAEKEQVNTIIQSWLQEGIIRPSISEYASPVVLAKKKDGSTRLCVDYRKFNRKIVKDRYPLPLIEDHLDRLQGSVFFSTLDLKDGFFHVPIEENSRKYTGFIVPEGH